MTGDFVPGAPSGASLSPEDIDMARARLGYLDTNYDTPGGVTGAWHDVKDLFGAASPLLSTDQLAEKASIGSILASTGVDTSAVYDEFGLQTMQGAGPIWSNVIAPAARGVVAAQQSMFTPYPTLESSKNAQLASLEEFSKQQQAIVSDSDSPFWMKALAANALAETRQTIGGVAAMPTTNADIAGSVLGATPLAELDFATFAGHPVTAIAEGLLGNTGIGAVPVNGAARNVPLGFESESQFLDAAKKLQDAMRANGITDATVGVRGSSVSGFGGNPRSPTFGQPFGPSSDIDLFVLSDQAVGQFKNQPNFVHPDKVVDAFPNLED